MKTIRVQTNKPYDVIIGSGILSQLGESLRIFCNGKKVAVLSDSNVWPLDGESARESLQKSGFEVITFVFPAGESSKNGGTYLEILNFLAENKLTRSDCLVALGGGVVGDLGGFVSATYLRGIAYVQVPTTLLAAVDSSVGGKTAIDLPAGKNLAGAFYQPRLVLCDTNTLNTLPEDIFQDGCAEVIKYAVLFDADLFAHLKQFGISFDREAVIAQCVQHKANVVKEDEFDTGTRMLLNLGHTVGHGIEAASGYTISHGKAVAAGMAIIARASVKMGLCGKNATQDICDLLQRFSLPTQTEFTADALLDAMLSDKKRAGDSITLVVPKTIGNCVLLPTPVKELPTFIKAGF
jgi:3-dehydroquinate synthase